MLVGAQLAQASDPPPSYFILRNFPTLLLIRTPPLIRDLGVPCLISSTNFSTLQPNDVIGTIQSINCRVAMNYSFTCGLLF